MSRHGNNGSSIYVWDDNAKFDRYYDNKKNGVHYSKINYIANNLSETQLWNLQRSKFKKELQTNDNVAIMKSLINNLSNDAILFQQDADSVTSGSIAQNVYSRVIQILNQGLLGIAGSGETLYGQFRDTGFDVKSEEFSQIADKVLMLYNELSTYYQQGYIDQRALLLFNSKFGFILKQLGVTASSAGLAASFHEYIGKGARAKDYEDLKAKEAEYLVDEMITNNAEMNQIFGSINSGAFLDAATKMVIEDTFIYQKSGTGSTNFKNGEALIFTEAKTQIPHTVHTWEEFENAVKKLNAKKISIVLDNEAHRLLQGSRALAIQTKSHRGGPDSIVNKTDRFSITLKEIEFNQMLFTRLLNDFKSIESIESIKSIDYKAEDSNLALLANLYLTRHILKTQLIHNDLYFTEYGLETVDEWMERKRKVLEFTPAIKTAYMAMNLTAANKYNFVSIS